MLRLFQKIWAISTLYVLNVAEVRTKQGDRVDPADLRTEFGMDRIRFIQPPVSA